jgi:hypothetical protein
MKILPVALITVSFTVQAQDPSIDAPAPDANGSCTTAQHRQFDFWVGRWEVTTGKQAAGRNQIDLIHSGCALAEHWTSAAGNFSGSSLNTYDQATERWHQTWVDTSGTLLELNGGLEGNRMIMSGARPGPDGTMVTHRITWTPNEDGSVRQVWETSADGSDWTAVFDGLYVRETEDR